MNLLKSHVYHYRPDIDGLRALAVSMVVLFHFWPKILPGGFIGVDIFFVISGFLITSIIYREKLSSTFSIKHFYLRRIKRILPAFFVMLFLTYICAYFFLLPGDFSDFARNAVCSSIYLSNVCFMGSADYFAVSSAENPLLHTWSLAVEEQYYLLWPALFLPFVKLLNKRALYFYIFSLFLLSFIFSIYCLYHAPKVGYYTVFSRAFELMLGGIIAVYATSKLDKKISSNAAPTLIIANVMSVAGALLILLASFFLSEKKPFPGYNALIPTIGAVLIIYSGQICQKTWINQFFANRVMVGTGLISYSIYLFHWPAIAFWNYFSPDDSPSLVVGMLLLAAVVSVSFLTYKWVEIPFKKFHFSFRKCFSLYQLLPMLIILAASVFVTKSDGVPSRIKPVFYQQSDFISKKYCYNEKNLNKCIFGKNNHKKPKIVFFGDSHAVHFFPLFDNMGKKYNFSIEMFSTSSCYPLLDAMNNLPSKDKGLRNPSCHAQIEYITSHYEDFDVFILSGSFNHYINDEDLHPKSFDFLVEFSNTVKFLTNHGKKVIVMGDIPLETKNEIVYLARQQAVFGSSEQFKEFKRQIKMQNQIEVNNTIKAVTESYKNTYYFDTYYQIFYQLNELPFYHGILIYKNSTHLNKTGSELIAKYYLSLPNNSIKDKLIEWGVINDKNKVR